MAYEKEASLRKRWESLRCGKITITEGGERHLSTNHHRRRCVHRLSRNRLTPRSNAFYVNPRKSVMIRGVANAMLNR